MTGKEKQSTDRAWHTHTQSSIEDQQPVGDYLLATASLSPLGYLGFHVFLIHLIAHAQCEAADHEALCTHTHVDQIH